MELNEKFPIPIAVRCIKCNQFKNPRDNCRRITNNPYPQPNKWICEDCEKKKGGNKKHRR